MRILQVSSARTRGGGERHFADLATALVARGHEVYAALAPAAPLHSELHALPAGRIITLPLRNALDLNSARALAQFARAQKIDIIHAHVARDYPLAAYAAHRAAGARLVITRHVPFPLSKVHRFVLARVACVIAVSAAVAEGLRAQQIFPAAKIRVVPNGLDLTRTAAIDRAAARAQLLQRLPAPADLLVGTVGDLSAVKGQDLLVRAAALVHARGLTNVAFLFVGEDTSAGAKTRALLTQLSAAHGLAQHVHLLGRLPDIGPFVAALDVYASPSRAEAFGLALAEAQACGVPAVASATAGSQEIIVDGTTGRLVPVGTHEALADALGELLRDAPARARMGAQARARVHACFSLERMVAATEQIYQAVLDET